MNDTLIDTSSVLTKYNIDDTVSDIVYTDGDCLIEILNVDNIPLQFFNNILLLAESNAEKNTKPLFLSLEGTIEFLGHYTEDNLQNVYILCKDLLNTKIKLHNFQKYNKNLILSLKSVFDT